MCFDDMKKLILILFVVFATTLRADLLTEITGGNFAAKPLPQYTLLPDGETYAQLSDNMIIRYDLRSGDAVDTLFSASMLKSGEIENVEGFMLSPTERYMLLYNNSKKVFRRSRVADWYIYDMHRKQLKPLSEEMPVASPVFSPNGKYIAFSRANNIFIHKLDFSTEVAVTTDGKEGGVINGISDWLYEEEFSQVASYCFSPDSKQLAFIRLDETNVKTFSWQTFLSEDGKTGYPENHQVKYPRAGEKNAVASAVVYDTYYKTLKTMSLPADDDSYIPRIVWTNDAEKLAVFRLNRNQNKLEMYVANPKSTVANLVYTEENKNGCVNFEQIDEWQFLSDNTMVVVNETSGWRHAYLYSVNGQKLKQLTSGEFDVTQVYGYDESSQTLYYQAALPTPMSKQVFSLNAKKNKTTCLTPEEGIHNATFAGEYKYFIDNYSSVTQPNKYTLYSNNGKEVRELLNNDELLEMTSSAGLTQKHFFSFATERGDTLNGWIILPEALDSLYPGDLQQLTSDAQKYPLLIFQYSGPQSQQVLNRWKIDWEHYLAREKEVVVACVDPRGTNSRGRGFRNLTYMNIGKKEAEDQISAANHIASLGFVDSTRMGIWGWSYGGFQTLMTMSQANSPFRCGIAVAPVTDFRLYDSAYTERFMRRPQSNEFGYKACSLPLMAENLQGRVLLVHGLADDNVHCQNMWLYVDALVRAGKQFDMQIYPDDNHFLRKRSNYEHLYKRMTEFIDNNLIKQ